MLLWWITLAILASGAAGGMLNALLSDSGFILPGRYDTEGGGKIWKPGALGNVFLGIAAAFITWGLYGPFSEYILIPLNFQNPQGGANLTLSTLVGAFLVGIGGSRIITAEVDKVVLSRAATKAATAQPNGDMAAAIATASSPTDALEAASKR